MNNMTLSHSELERYKRHIMLPEIGTEGQLKLKAASVLIIGTGGLGSPISMYLAASGIGRIGLLDFDVVDASNLQRQIVHKNSSIGINKTESAKTSLLEINPHIQVDIHNTKLMADNAMSIIKQYDLICDGTDNFETRYLINDTCIKARKINVFGSIRQFEGQVSVFGQTDGPCYRCLYPEAPAAGTVPAASQLGVMGILPGVIGSIQATEVVKLITGIGQPLVGRLLDYNALNMEFKELRFIKDPECPCCSRQIN